MMSVYAVMVNDGNGHRWMDSLWVQKYGLHGAESRRDLLKRSFDAMIAYEHKCTSYIVELSLEDGEILPSRTAEPQPEATDAANPKAGS